MLWQRSSSLMVHQYFRKISMSCRSYTTKVGSLSAKNVSTPEASTAKDLILYKFESPRFFKFLNIFAITQYSVWMFISVSSMSMIDVPVPEMTKKEEEDAPFWKKINLGSDKYKYGLALGSAIMGFGILCASWLYTLRSVRYLVLRKDAKTVSFVTYAPFGRNRIMEVPIANISAEGSRTSGASQMPVKVKGKKMFYLLELRDGKFIHPQLFDKTVGTKRKLI